MWKVTKMSAENVKSSCSLMDAIDGRGGNYQGSQRFRLWKHSFAVVIKMREWRKTTKKNDIVKIISLYSFKTT
jgi:hypothetical protein